MSKAPKTILVVDDEPGVLELVKIILSRQGYEVLTAESGPKALETCAQHHSVIDLLLTDVMMPAMSGFTLVRGVRSLNPKLPVVYMTGGALAGMADGELDAQSNLLKKPFDPETLLRAVTDLLGRGAAA